MISIHPRFAATPDVLFRDLSNIVQICMWLRDSAHFFITMELYRDCAPSEALCVLAEYLGELPENMRLFPFSSKGYLINGSLTHTSTSGVLEDHIRHRHKFVYEVLDHSIELFKTHTQLHVSWCHGDAAMTTTIVLPMFPKQASLNEVFEVVRDLLIKKGVLVPPKGARIRVLEIDNNVVRRTWPMTTPGVDVSHKVIRMEAVPEDQLAFPDNQLLWCHCSSEMFKPFAMRVHAGEKAADFRLRLAARLGISRKQISRTFILYRSVKGGTKLEAIDATAVVSSMDAFPAFLPQAHHDAYPNQQAPPWSVLPALRMYY